MTRRQPILTPEQYREASKLLRVEVTNVAWSLAVSPSLVGLERRWRALGSDETHEVFDRLMAAAARHASLDRVLLRDKP